MKKWKKWIFRFRQQTPINANQGKNFFFSFIKPYFQVRKQVSKYELLEHDPACLSIFCGGAIHSGNHLIDMCMVQVLPSYLLSRTQLPEMFLLKLWKDAFLCSAWILLEHFMMIISFSSSNTQFYDSRISISQNSGCCKVCFFLFNRTSYIGILGALWY